MLIDALLELNEDEMKTYLELINDGHTTLEILTVLNPTKALQINLMELLN